MLSDGMSGQPTTRPWHHSDYMRWRYKLAQTANGQQELIQIEAAIQAGIANAQTVSVPSIFGTDWSNTVFEPIWDTCANQSWNQARLCAGLFLCDMMIRDADDWVWFDTDTSEGHMRKVYFRR